MSEEKLDVPRVTFNISAEHREFLEKLPKGIRSKTVSCLIQLMIDHTGKESLFAKLIDPLFNGRLVLAEKEKKDDARGADLDEYLRVD